eukprot:jgi/Chlat1/522/Chrsp103S00993
MARTAMKLDVQSPNDVAVAAASPSISPEDGVYDDSSDGAVSTRGGRSQRKQQNNHKYIRYTPEQVEALERVYLESPKPSSSRRQQLIADCPILRNIEPKQIKVWFQNRRCREKQRAESVKLRSQNNKLLSINKQLLEDNARLQRQYAVLTAEMEQLKQAALLAGQVMVPVKQQGEDAPWLSPYYTGLASSILSSYRHHTGISLITKEEEALYNNNPALALWSAKPPTIFLEWRGQPVFTYANRNGLAFYDTTFEELSNLSFGKVVDEKGRAERENLLAMIAHKGAAGLASGVRYTAKGAAVKFEHALMWTVFEEKTEQVLGLASMAFNWSRDPLPEEL